MLKLNDYLCTKCGELFEKLTHNHGDVECPRCGSTKTVFQHAPQAIKAKGVGVHDTRMRV